MIAGISMGASVNAYWPGITDEQMGSQPGFCNDCKAWGDWMAEGFSEPEVLEAIENLKAGAILTFISAGISEEDVDWVTPQALRDAAQKLRRAVQSDQPEAKIILQVYARNAGDLGPPDKAFIQDLDDVEEIANWAEKEGATQMTLEVNW